MTARALTTAALASLIFLLPVPLQNCEVGDPGCHAENDGPPNFLERLYTLPEAAKLLSTITDQEHVNVVFVSTQFHPTPAAQQLANQLITTIRNEERRGHVTTMDIDVALTNARETLLGGCPVRTCQQGMTIPAHIEQLRSLREPFSPRSPTH